MALLKDRYPEAYAYAFLGVNGNLPKRGQITDVALARYLTEQTGYNWNPDYIRREAAYLRAKAAQEERGPVDPTEPDVQPSEVDTKQSVDKQIEEKRKYLAAQAEKKLIREMVTEQARFLEYVDRIEQAIAMTPTPHPIKPRVVELEDGEVHMAVVISDTQVGMLVDGAEVGLKHAYSTKTFDARWEKLQEEVFKIKARIERSGRAVSGVHLWFDGDLIENHLMRAKARLDVDMTTITQTIYFARKAEEFVWRCAEVFPEVWVDVVIGNHGRVGKAGEDRTYDSFDYLIGVMLEKAFAAVSGVHVKAWTQPWAVIEVGDIRVLLNHGHNINSWGSIPFYGILNRIPRWQGLHRQFFNYAILGHFHTPATFDTNGGCEVIVNGAFMSGSAYSITELGLATPAAQWCFVLDKKDGIVERYKIKLGDESEEQPTPPRKEW